MTSRYNPGRLGLIGRASGDKMMRRSSLLLGCLIGCSSVSKDAPQITAADDEMGAFDTGFRSDGQEPSAEALTPTGWRLSGTLEVAEGSLDARLSYLTADVHGLEGDVICSQGLGLVTALKMADLPDPDLQSWWEIKVDPSLGGGCDDLGMQVPTSHPMYLGLGPLHPEIEAVLDSEAGSAPPEDVEVRSVFVALGEEASIWVFGVATMDDSVASDFLDGSIAGSLLPDGQWKFKALYSFPY